MVSRLLHPRNLIMAALLLLGLLGAGPARAAASPTVYVDQASVGGPCSDAYTAAENTTAQPWCTLARGLRAAPDGSVVAVRQAAYAELVVSDLYRTGFVTLTPYAGEVPTIAGADLQRVGRLRFEGLRITAGVSM